MSTTTFPLTLSAGTLIGDPVRNSSGKDLGKVHELMIDIHSGRVAYAVLSFGGFLGVGTKLFAVPWDVLQVDTEEHAVVFDVDKEALQRAPGFDPDHWPDTADPRWHSEIHSHYEVRPYWE